MDGFKVQNQACFSSAPSVSPLTDSRPQEYSSSELEAFEEQASVQLTLHLI